CGAASRGPSGPARSAESGKDDLVNAHNDQELVDILEEVWSSIEALGEDLRENEWKRPTELPGWSVQDNLVHLSAVESMSLGRPADLDSRGAKFTQGMIVDAMPFVVGKKVGPPEGSTIVFSLSGLLPREVVITVVSGRAKPVDDVPERPSVRLAMDCAIFERLACGRVEPKRAVDAGEVLIDGDDELGRRLVGEMNYMF